MNPNLARSASISGDAFRESSYFEGAEQSTARQWNYYIWPRLRGADFDSVVDLGAGFGRNAVFLSRHARSTICLDINEEAVAACRSRFKGDKSVTVQKNDGVDFRGIDATSTTLVFSFDAMVHFEPEIVESYVFDAARILKPGGIGFFHHSNYTEGYGLDFRKTPHWRNFMSKDIFAYFAKKAGLHIVSQAVVDWDESLVDASNPDHAVKALDCISMLRKPL